MFLSNLLVVEQKDDYINVESSRSRKFFCRSMFPIEKSTCGVEALEMKCGRSKYDIRFVQIPI